MRKVLFIMIFAIISFVLTACGPTTTQASQNTNLSQSTTAAVTTTNIPVTFIEIVADIQEVCQSAVVTFTINVLPANATNPNYTITMANNVMMDFVAGTSNTQAEVLGNPPTGTEIGQVIFTVTSDDNQSIDNTVTIYVYPDTESPPQCQLN